ncbi:MAG: hypothetical protein ACFB2Z_15065 [Maricaulaceae bacterium]
MADIKKRLIALVGLAGLSASGCALGAAAGAGYVAGDEIEEGDEFDPLEDVIESDD